MGLCNLKSPNMKKKRMIVSCVQDVSKFGPKSKLNEVIPFTKFANQDLGRGQDYHNSLEF